MTKKFYYLKSCDTCRRIMKEVGIDGSFDIIDIKSTPLTEREIDHMRSLSGSYEVLFSRRSRKYKSMGLEKKALNEEDIRALILEEYTFLKRPVAIIEDSIFIGNSSQTVKALVEANLRIQP